MNGNYIGKDALQEIAVKHTQEVVMGAVFFRPDVFKRLRIKVISGLQYKDVATVMNRKGHTTRRKVVGEPVLSQMGYLEEREMVGHLAWNRYMDNRDNYVEKAVYSEDPDHSSEFSYPASELAFKVAVANYGEDIFECLWHGDDSIDDKAKNAYLNLYTGFITYLNRDVESGRISEANHNLVKTNAIEAVSGPTDIAAYTEFKKFRQAWSQNLKNAPLVLVYCNDETGMAIREAYGNSKANNSGVIEVGNGNFKIPMWPNIEICPESSMGKGYKLIATTPENFEYGVDTESSKTKITVQEGSDNDTEDIFFQVQSIQGTRVRNVNPSNFCMTDAALTHIEASGDYTKNSLEAIANNPKLGTVQVNGTASDPTKEFTTGETITLKANNGTGTFVRWSNGATDAQIKVIKKDCPEVYVAIFQGA